MGLQHSGCYTSPGPILRPHDKGPGEREREDLQWDAGAQKKAGHTIKRGEEEVDQSCYTQQIYLTEECRSTE